MLARVLRRLALVSFVVGLLAPAAAMAKPITGRQAPYVIKREMRAKIDKAGVWKSELAGKPGDRMRSFRANNLHTLALNGPSRITVGHMITGMIDMHTSRVKVVGHAVPRSRGVPSRSR